MQGPGYSLPGISQTLQQPQMHAQNQANLERELRERDIESNTEEMAKREAEQREREIRDRQQHEHVAHENHSGPIQIHQPVAVAPSTRTIHGPNGLLGNSGPLGGPNALSAPLGAPNGPGNIFGAATVQQADTTPRMQHAVQPPPQQSMLMPFGGPGMQPGPLVMGQGQQPILNDALSYLDQVKVQFANHPDVYNRFLDIMKDFKSGAIDTPGVIERVSTLFAGNPNLIQGFNTFLPPGYKIECGTGGDPNAIRVTTPMGTTVQSMPVPRPLSAPRSSAVNGNGTGPSESPYYDSGSRGASGNWQQAREQEAQEAMFSPSNRNLGHQLYINQQSQNNQAPLSPEVAAQRNHQDAASTAAAMAHQQEQRGVSQLQNAVSAATGRSILSPSADASTPLPGQTVNGASHGAQALGVGPAGEKRGPVEFNHAISYVNKIKNRFATQPDIYKQFLEILQTYQRESKPIQDVYAQVTTLFNSAPDLLEDFKQFLPESAAQHRAAQQQAARHAAEDAVMLSNVRGDTGYQPATTNQHQTPRTETSRLPPMGNFAPTPTANRDNKRKRGDRQVPGPTSTTAATSMAPDVGNANLRTGYGQGSLAKRAKTTHNAKQPVVPDGPAVSPTLIPAMPEPIPPTITTVATHEELAFFDRAKKFIGNKNNMNEFLKLCNLFSQDLIDKSFLLSRSQRFIGGNPELFAWFKTFLGVDETELTQTKAKTVTSRVALSNCRGLGPSYRLLPKRERERPCSGRDQLCKSVLNDEWASHPTWASEDSGFVAHRKNQFEEGLHRIEEERHDYDFNIEACLRTIQQLEPIASQLLQTAPEDRLNFVLPAGLGGQSETIYKRVIMKIYGREKGREVIAELFAQPYNVIPILLNRLKQKLEEWKAAQREWEKVWREQTQKIFWKSLDHQSLVSKQADKRQFQLKTLQNEIQVKFEEQRRQLEIQEIQTPPYQFAYPFKDQDVLFDASRLILTYVEHSHTTDYTRVVTFIKEFVPLFFGIDPAVFEQRIQTSANGSPVNESGDEETPSPDDGFSHKLHKGKKATLLRGVLDRGRSGKPGRKDKEDSVASGSRDSTPEVSSAVEEELAGAAESSNSSGRKGDRAGRRWAEYATETDDPSPDSRDANKPYSRDSYNMYCNLQFYCFFRMFVILYERLLNIKQNEAEVRETVARAKAWKAAAELKMIDKTPEEFFSDTSPSANYYDQILGMFEEQIKGEIDISMIEDTLRRYYLQTGWQLYSFDRLLSALVRFGVALFTSDPKDKSAEIYQLFKKDRPNKETTCKKELEYRNAVQRLAKDAEIYKIEYDSVKMEANVRILKKDEATFNNSSLNAAKKFRYYIATYTLVEPTENISLHKVHHPFLKHSFHKPEETPGDRYDTVTIEEKKAFKIKPASYRIAFQGVKDNEPHGGVDYLVQNDAVRSGFLDGNEEMQRVAETRHEIMQERFVMNNAWMRNLSRDDVDARKTAFRKNVEEPAAVPAEAEAEVIDEEIGDA